ncbi:MAG: hypothetical protein K6E36_01280 [Oscillospiraceae bacterium]|nr:hypothetical protein [Oscillospiraceae bacterium]MCR5305120.1 hypothetical protein [Oscillospiraceae bacterium]
MAIGFPVRNMGRMQQNRQQTVHRTAEPAAPPVPPPAASAPSAAPLPQSLRGLLPDGLHLDRDTLLILGILLLLYREHTDKKLLLALLYILL